MKIFDFRRTDFSSERLDGEFIGIDFASGNYFSAEGSGADVIWLIQHHVLFGNWYPLLSRSYGEMPTEETFVNQVEKFVNELQDLGLLNETDQVRSETKPSLDLPNDTVRETWIAPSLKVNSDLVDLLIIDPIHDSSEQGWPSVGNN